MSLKRKCRPSQIFQCFWPACTSFKTAHKRRCGFATFCLLSNFLHISEKPLTVSGQGSPSKWANSENRLLLKPNRLPHLQRAQKLDRWLKSRRSKVQTRSTSSHLRFSHSLSLSRMDKKRWFKKRWTHLICGCHPNRRRLSLKWMWSCGADLEDLLWARTQRQTSKSPCTAQTLLLKTVIQKLSLSSTCKFRSPD